MGSRSSRAVSVSRPRCRAEGQNFPRQRIAAAEASNPRQMAFRLTLSEALSRHTSVYGEFVERGGMAAVGPAWVSQTGSGWISFS